jgi:o-succinylbenzoate---CoA ligase
MDSKTRRYNEQEPFDSTRLKMQSGHIFISDDSKTVTFGQLSRFSSQLNYNATERGFKSNKDKCILFADKDLKTSLVIASCLLNQIPFVAVPHSITNEKLEQVIQQTGANYFFDSNTPDYELSELTSVKVPHTDSILTDNYLFHVQDVDPARLFAILFTSGTTSESKAVPIKYGQLLQAVKSSSDNLPLKESDEWLLNLPLHHIGGISVLVRSIFSGSQVYLLQSSEIDKLREVLSTRYSLTHASLVPTQLKRLLDIPDFRTHKYFKAILLGGGPISPSLHQRALSAGIPLIPSFGMTESSAQCIAVPYSYWKQAPLGSSGKPLCGVEVDIRSDVTLETQQGKVLWLRGPQIITSYFDTSLNQTSFDEDGWFCTGDYANMDENGYIFIEMRRSDRIVSGGENVNPFIVEEALESLSMVKEAAVFGIPDEEWGQLICACVVANERSAEINPNEITIKLKSVLPGFMIPKKYIQLATLPRTSSGKLIRTELPNLVSNI